MLLTDKILEKPQKPISEDAIELLARYHIPTEPLKDPPPYDLPLPKRPSHLRRHSLHRLDFPNLICQLSIGNP